jgi:adenylate cyclase
MRFRIRVLLLLAGLVAAALGVMLLVVNRSAEREAVADIRGRFDRAAGTFQELVDRENDESAALASLLAADYAFKRAFADADSLTLESNLKSHLGVRLRESAHAIAVVMPEGDTRAALQRSGPVAAPRLFAPLIERADTAGEDRAEGCVWLGDALHEFVLVPMLAPDLVAWVGLGRHIDAALAADLGQRSRLEVVFMRDRPAAVLATTLSPALAEAFLFAAPPASAPRAPATLTLAGERHLVARIALPHFAEAGASAFVLASLDASLAPTRRLQSRLLIAGAGLLAVALVAATLFARSLSQPVQRLATHTRLIAAGDYETRIDLRRRDEFGALAESFNVMSAGLAERDQVRDLLDKNVSPEVAARMMRDGTALGGEERAVTVLFCDLRGFTPLSEGLSPPELVALLNRYLDRMSAAIEAEGGVIDKYIGDEIMALFGAPVAAPDSADRAVRAALAMRVALTGLNRELAAEGRPPLAFGVGINTARVVAGNIGSHRRLNYSVIGDGVNLAARLQTLTRKPDYATDIIVSDFTRAALTSPATLRDLGEVTVKGKSIAVRIHAVA